MTTLKLDKIYKKYPNATHYSVEDFSIDIKDKEFIVFVGPSGCGKSTTLRMVAGLEEISEGKLYIDGEVVNDKSPKDRDIAMVFQNYALYPHMTVYENMAFGLKLRKYKKDDIDKRVREAAASLGLTEFLDRKPADLSGGQRQRVAMGRAIVMLKSSSWMNLSQTWMLNFVSLCVLKLLKLLVILAQQPSMLLTTKQKP